jgi:hypothetical protein
MGAPAATWEGEWFACLRTEEIALYKVIVTS